MDVAVEEPMEPMAPQPEASQVKVVFTTTDTDIQLPEGKRQLLVPAGQNIS
jgi:ribosome biogenesis protein YTM1